MNKAIILENGTLKYKAFREPKLNSKSAIVENKVFGINYDDYNVFSGKILNSNKHGIMGIEASGIITEVSEDCTRGFQIGDRVCYATYTPGSFVERRCIHEDFLVPIPRYASFEDGATLLKGLTAYTLLGKVFTINPSSVIILSGASGAVGSYLTQIASKAGLKVIGLTRSDEKKDYIKSNGAFEVINYKKQPVVEAVDYITRGMKADFFFDCLGAEVQDFAFDLLKERGFFISFSNITGEATKINLTNQKQKSITVSRVSLGHFIKDSENLMLTSIAFFKNFQVGIARANIQSYNFFTDAEKALIDIKNGAGTGQKVFKI